MHVNHGRLPLYTHIHKIIILFLSRGYIYLIGSFFLFHLDFRSISHLPGRGYPGRGNAWSLLAGVDNRIRPSRAFEKRPARTVSRVQHVSRGKRFNIKIQISRRTRRGVLQHKTGGASAGCGEISYIPLPHIIHYKYI